MNILVTGATGFIGRHLVEKLSQSADNSIFCLVRNLVKAKILKPFDPELIYADITDKESLKKILDYKIDVIFHCAGYVENKNFQLLHSVNVVGTENICELAKKLKVKRLVYISSVAVVSGNTQVPLTEDLPFKATNIYGDSKIEAEKVALAYRKQGLPVVIVRPPMVYGEDEPHMMELLVLLIKRRLFPLINNGKSKFHLVYVKDVVDFMIFSLADDRCLKGTFFIADEEVFTVAQVCSIISKEIGARPPFKLPKFISPFLVRLPYVGKKIAFFLKDRAYSIERIKSLGFKPSGLACENLGNSVRSFLEN